MTIPVTFKDNPSYIQGQFQLHSRTLPVTFKDNPSYIQRQFQLHSRTILVTFKDNPSYIQRQFQLHSRTILVTFKDNPSDIQRQSQLHARTIPVAFKDNSSYIQGQFQNWCFNYNGIDPMVLFFVGKKHNVPYKNHCNYSPLSRIVCHFCCKWKCHKNIIAPIDLMTMYTVIY